VIFLKFGFKFWLLKITKSQLILALFGYISRWEKKRPAWYVHLY
jgi:hypothetical protein